MTPPAASRAVQCYHCRRGFEVSARAESTACPHCGDRVIVGDIVVKALKPVHRVQTCGRVVVQARGRINADLVEAHLGVEILGGLDARVHSGGPVLIGPKARWKGDCSAPSVEIHEGARIEGGEFRIPERRVGIGTDHAEEASERTS